MARLYLEDLCSVIRSKNAGPFLVTLDMMFKDEKDYFTVKENSLITPEIIALIYGISQKEIVVFETYDNVLAIKVTLKRKIPSGSIGDSDCYGMSQEAPLLQISLPAEMFDQ